MVAKAQGEVDAIQRAAREQARKQAQELVEAAANEANEIQNIHQLRLNSLKAEIADMDAHRTELLDYLKQMADMLLNVEKEAREKAPAPAETAAPEQPLDLQPVETPEVKLDLSETAIAKAAAELAAETPPEPEEPTEPNHVEPAGEPLPDPDEKPRHSFTLVSEESGFVTAEKPEKPAHEVPGAIFSQPIVRQQEPSVTEAPPTADPRRPVMPVLEEDDEDAEPEPAPAPRRGNDPKTARRRALAVHALRVLRRRKAGSR